MLRATSNKGFSLLEFVAVLALVSGMLLTFTQLRTMQHQQSLQQSLLDTIDHTRQALYSYFSEHDEFPLSITALTSSEDAITPWGRRLFIRHESIGVVLVVPVPNEAMLNWLKARLPMSQGEQLNLLVQLPAPIQTLISAAALHRVAVDGRPELNVMNADLNMGGFDISNFSKIKAEQALLNNLVSDEAVVGVLTTDEAVANKIVAVEADIITLNANLAEVNELLVNKANFEHLQVATMTSDMLETQQLQANQFTATWLTAESVVTEKLLTEQITAMDFITPQGSFNNSHQRLQVLELAWGECVATGGCR
ncbi:MAG TPA: hypothetical protein VKY35_02070 [Aliidiomarina sp.]|nr:hypothetical protein [Aliidiomarina sp.]